MNLLCPNCQKMVTVPEEVAGQTMNCPLCSKSFTVPGLPKTPAPLAPQPPWTGSANPSPPPPPSTSTPAPDVYSVRSEPTPAPKQSLSRESLPPLQEPSRAAAPEPPPTRIDATQHVCRCEMTSNSVQWIAPAAMVLVLILSFFSWVGAYAGNIAIISQSGWSAAFGGSTADADLVKIFTESEKWSPGVNGLLIVYIILLIPTVVVTLAAAALPAFERQVPANLRHFIPLRWGIAGLLLTITFLMLCFQLLVGFSLEQRWQIEAEKKIKAPAEASEKDKKVTEAMQAASIAMAHGTCALTCVFWLHLIAVISAGLTFWLGRRPNRPFPRFELHW